MTMRQSPKLRPNGWDILTAGVVLALAVACGILTWGRGGDGAAAAVVSVDGAEVERIALDRLTGVEERTYSNNGYTLHVRFGPEGAEVTTSDCPTQDCVRTGAISRGGQSIVCLPARIVIQLEGGGDRGVDLVIG